MLYYLFKSTIYIYSIGIYIYIYMSYMGYIVSWMCPSKTCGLDVGESGVSCQNQSMCEASVFQVGLQIRTKLKLPSAPPVLSLISRITAFITPGGGINSTCASPERVRKQHTQQEATNDCVYLQKGGQCCDFQQVPFPRLLQQLVPSITGILIIWI